MDIRKLCESLVILDSHADGLLTAIYNVRYLLDIPDGTTGSSTTLMPTIDLAQTSASAATSAATAASAAASSSASPLAASFTATSPVKRTDTMGSQFLSMLSPTAAQPSSAVASAAQLPMTSTRSLTSSASVQSFAASTLPLARDGNFLSVVKLLGKKFTETLDMSKVPGFMQLMDNAEAVLEELHVIYQLALDVAEYTEAASSVLLLCEQMQGIDFVQSHWLVMRIWKTLTQFYHIQTMWLSDASGYKRGTISLYGVMSQLFNKVPSTTYPLVVQHWVNYSKPLETMQRIFEPLGSMVSLSIQSMWNEFNKFGYVTGERLRKDALLQLTTNVKAVPKDDLRLAIVPMMAQFHSWVVIGMLLCPGELSRAENVEILKTVLGNHLVTSVVRNEFFNPAAQLEAVLKTSTSRAPKLKFSVSDVHGSNITAMIEMHQGRRTYLRNQLSTMVQLTDDRRFMLCTKFPVVEYVLNLSKEELLWYFSHQDRIIAMVSPKTLVKSTPNSALHPTDPAIIELIYLHLQMTDVVLRHQTVVSAFYAEQFRTVYAENFNASLAEISGKFKLNADLSSIFESIRSSLMNIGKGDLLSMRLNIGRCFAFLHLSVGLNVTAQVWKDFFALINEMNVRSRYIDDIMGILDGSSLRPLMVYRHMILESLDDALRSNSPSLRYVSHLLTLSQEFMEHVGVYYPHELPRIGANSIAFAEDVCTAMASYASLYIHEIATVDMYFAAQVCPSSAVMFAPDRRAKAKGKKTTASSSMQSRPGSESAFTSNVPVERLSAQKKALLNILHAIRSCGVLLIHDVEITPSQYLKEALFNKFQAFLFAAPFSDLPPTSPVSPKDASIDVAPPPIKRPSDLLSQISSYINLLQTQVHAIFPELGVDEVIEGALHQQLDPISARMLLADAEMSAMRPLLGAAKNKSTKALLSTYSLAPATTQSTSQSLLAAYTKWYTSILRDRATLGTIVTCRIRKSFISSNLWSFKVQEFVDRGELIALCRVLGVEGVRFLDDRLVRMVSALFKEIKENMQVNIDALTRMQLNAWKSESAFVGAMSTMKELDVIYDRFLNLSFIMEFRSYLADALADTLEADVPFVYNVVRAAHGRYPPNVYGQPEYENIDMLANKMGILKRVDSALMTELGKYCQNQMADGRLYSLLPFVFAVMLRQMAQDSRSVYHAHIDALENNAHCLDQTMSTLITCLIGNCMPNDLATLTAIHRDCLKVGATVLLRMSAGNPAIFQSDSWKSAVIVLSKFSQATPYVASDYLDRFIPYAIVSEAMSTRKEDVPRVGPKGGSDEELAVPA